MSKLNAGEIAISLGDDYFTLKPTLRAITVLSRQFGGLAAARQQLVNENLDAVVSVIRHGANLSDREAKGLDERVFANGLSADLLIPLIRYVAILGNGGKPLPDEPVDVGFDEPATEGNS